MSDFSLVGVGAGKKSGKMVASYAFRAVRGEGGVDAVEGARLSMGAFVLGLRLPPQVFWVNLNPKEPNRIVHQTLARTEVGRVLLEADLQMKRDFCRFTDPRDSDASREYWREIRRAAGQGTSGPSEIRTMNRTWIVPGEVEVSAESGQVRIESAPLRVCLESEYFGAKGIQVGSAVGKAAQRKCEAVTKRLILPKVEELVNGGDDYRELRRAYHGIILANCWRKGIGRSGSVVEGLAARTTEAELVAKPGWTFKATYDAYLKSLREGEYDFTEESPEQKDADTYVVSSRYFGGGVDFTRLKVRVVSRRTGGVKAAKPSSPRSPTRTPPTQSARTAAVPQKASSGQKPPATPTPSSDEILIVGTAAL